MPSYYSTLQWSDHICNKQLPSRFQLDLARRGFLGPDGSLLGSAGGLGGTGWKGTRLAADSSISLLPMAHHSWTPGSWTRSLISLRLTGSSGGKPFIFSHFKSSSCLRPCDVRITRMGSRISGPEGSTAGLPWQVPR
jgi:hypothetical protein